MPQEHRHSDAAADDNERIQALKGKPKKQLSEATKSKRLAFAKRAGTLPGEIQFKERQQHPFPEGLAPHQPRSLLNWERLGLLGLQNGLQRLQNFHRVQRGAAKRGQINANKLLEECFSRHEGEAAIMHLFGGKQNWSLKSNMG